MKYTWNEGKAKKVKAEHKIDFKKLEDVFADPFAVEFIDESHSTNDEIRFGIIGFTAEYGLIYRVFTEPAEGELHFITTRRAENWMIKEYEQNRGRS